MHDRIAEGRDPAPSVAGLSRFFVDIAAECPYGLRRHGLFRQARFGWLPEETMARLLAAGYRRSGNTIYTMECANCRSCVPIRIIPGTFRPNRNQRRSLRNNGDIEAQIGPLIMSEENLNLLDKFLAARHPNPSQRAKDYYAGFFLNTTTQTVEIAYRSRGELLGVAIVDVGAAWLNAVYFYFDPDAGKRSLGTYNILRLIELCRLQAIDFLYLGYWIDRVSAMRYKANFKPHQLLLRGSWQPVT